MPVRIFVSYSHADEKSLERLHKHLAVLQRDGALETWHDQAISAGANINDAINSKLNSSEIFICLVSPDYLASKYCYEREFQRALELSTEGKLQIVPIIVEPCDWMSTPLSAGKALPKDGRAISEWTNPNNAYLDIVTNLRKLLVDIHQPTPKIQIVEGIIEGSTIRKVRLRRDFDSIQKSDFADETFNEIQEYFRYASHELQIASEDLKTKFEHISPTAFTCSIVNRASRRNAEAHITVHNNKARSYFGEISFVYERHAQSGSSNGSIRVEADEYNMYLVTDYAMGQRGTPRFGPRQAAEWLWNQFIERAGVTYE